MTAEANILVLGVEGDLASELAGALAGLKHNVVFEFDTAPGDFPARLRSTAADLVFCGHKPEVLEAMLVAAGHVRPGLPVVVVSDKAEVPAWLDALEAGAADYCAAPFESAHLGWILECLITRVHVASA